MPGLAQKHLDRNFRVRPAVLLARTLAPATRTFPQVLDLWAGIVGTGIGTMESLGHSTSPGKSLSAKAVCRVQLGKPGNG